MIIKVHLSIGLIGGRNDKIEIDDEELDGLDAAAREAYIDAEVRAWAYNYIEWSWEAEVRPEIVDDFQSGPPIRAALADDAGAPLLAELAGRGLRWSHYADAASELRPQRRAG